MDRTPPLLEPDPVVVRMSTIPWYGALPRPLSVSDQRRVLDKDGKIATFGTLRSAPAP